MSAQRALAAAVSVAGEQGVPCGEAAVAHAGSNVLVHLAPSPVVARVMTGTVALHDDPGRWLSREVAVLRFLAPTGLAVAPSPLVDPGPYEADGLWMTLWARVEVQGRSEADDPERLGRSLRELHEALAGFDGELDGFDDLHRDIERLRRQLRPSSALGAGRIEQLGERLDALSDSLFGLPWPAQTLHGDATLSNLLSTSEGPLWNDFEDVFRGPVQWDLIGFAMSLEFAGADPAFLGRMLDAYGWGDEGELQPFREAHEVYDEIWRLYSAQ